MFGEGVDAVSGDHKMVKDPDVHQGQGLRQCTGKQQVGLAGIGAAGRMRNTSISPAAL
jgi:hypothetical protein